MSTQTIVDYIRGLGAIFANFFNQLPQQNKPYHFSTRWSFKSKSYEAVNQHLLQFFNNKGRSFYEWEIMKLIEGGKVSLNKMEDISLVGCFFHRNK